MARNSQYADVAVRCPFFQKQTDMLVYCEGIEGVHSVTLNFSRKMQKQVYSSSFCCNHYEQCQVYKEVMKKYES